AEIAGLTRADFINALSRLKVSPFQYTPEELRSELNDAHLPSRGQLFTSDCLVQQWTGGIARATLASSASTWCCLERGACWGSTRRCRPTIAHYLLGATDGGPSHRTSYCGMGFRARRV